MSVKIFIDFSASKVCAGYFGDFGFSIPAGATITGIELNMEAQWGQNNDRMEFQMYLRNPSGDIGAITTAWNYFSQSEATNTETDDDADSQLFGLAIAVQHKQTITHKYMMSSSICRI